MESDNRKDSKSFLSNEYRSAGKAYSKQSLERRKAQEEEFLAQEIDYRNFVFAPEGYEGPVLFLYILTIPYLVGLSFLYLFIARARYEYFLDFNLTSYLAIWAIGYEVTAVLILAIIFLKWINHHNNRWSKEQARKRNRPKRGH